METGKYLVSMPALELIIFVMAASVEALIFLFLTFLYGNRFKAQNMGLRYLNVALIF